LATGENYSAASIHGEPTLDERNRADHEADGLEYSRQMTEAAGHETPQRALFVAEICDGIRNDLYDEMFAFVDLAPKTALYRHVTSETVNYNQPMGLDFNLKFRISKAGVINESRAKEVAKEDDVDVGLGALAEARGDHEAVEQVGVTLDVLELVRGGRVDEGAPKASVLIAHIVIYYI
jgi:hypothetical protein